MSEKDIPQECKFICDICKLYKKANELEPSCVYLGVTGAICSDMEHLCYILKTKDKLIDAFKKYLPAIKGKTYTEDEVKDMYDKYISEGKRSIKEFKDFLIINGAEITE